MKYANIKIRVPTEEISQQVQLALNASQGATWEDKEGFYVQHTDKLFLYVSRENYFTYSNSRENFNNDTGRREVQYHEILSSMGQRTRPQIGDEFPVGIINEYIATHSTCLYLASENRWTTRPQFFNPSNGAMRTVLWVGDYMMIPCVRFMTKDDAFVHYEMRGDNFLNFARDRGWRAPEDRQSTNVNTNNKQNHEQKHKQGSSINVPSKAATISTGQRPTGVGIIGRTLKPAITSRHIRDQGVIGQGS